MNLPTVRQLSYLVALDKHRHFGKAAEACFVSQSAFSMGIKELESLLEAQFVDRTNKSVTITNIGQDVATQARLCLNDIELLVEIAKRNREPLCGPLKMGIIPTIAPFFLPDMVPKLRKQFPKLKLYFREDVTQRIYEQLMAGNLDLILIALPYDLRNVELMNLFKDHFWLACRKNTKLVDPENYAFNRLDSESILLLEDGHCLRDHALMACKIRKLDKVSRFSATSLYTLLNMVDNDLGITFIPEMAKDSALLVNTRIKNYPLKENSYREIGLVWRKNSARGKEFRLLGEVIKQNHGSRKQGKTVRQSPGI